MGSQHKVPRGGGSEDFMEAKLEDVLGDAETLSSWTRREKEVTMKGEAGVKSQRQEIVLKL